MSDIRVLYINTDGLQQEHSATADSVQFLSYKTANKELTDTKLSHLIDGADAADEHLHDTRYYRKNQFINVSTGATDAAKPILTDAAGKLDTSFINITTLNPLLDHGNLLPASLLDDDHPQYLRTDGTRNLTGIQSYATHPSFTTDTQLVDKKFVEDLVAGQEWYNSVLTRSITPPGSPATGARYLIDSSLGTPTGVWVGHANQVATWNGSAYTYQTPSAGTHVSADDETNIIYLFNGTAWTAKYHEVTTASTGLTKVGFDIQIDPASAGLGLGFTTGVYNVNVDNSSIEINADTLRVKALGIKDTMIDFGTGAGQVSGLDIPLADAGNYFPTKNVEAATQYLASQLLVRGVDYTVAAGGVTKGDLVFLSANDTVAKFSTITNNNTAPGIAAATVAAAGTVRILADDTLLTGVLTGATAGGPVYWTGTTYSQTMPTGLGANVWQVGIAKNATDLHVDVQHVKKNFLS